VFQSWGIRLSVGGGREGITAWRAHPHCNYDIIMKPRPMHAALQQIMFKIKRVICRHAALSDRHGRRAPAVPLT